jgi:hypothetical protein
MLDTQMDERKKRTLEAAGFRIGDAEDFLELSEQERRVVELRLAVSRTIRHLRHQKNLTQVELAQRVKSSQSRIAKLEAGAGDVSLDLLFRCLFALGGSLGDLHGSRSPARKPLKSSAPLRALKT